MDAAGKAAAHDHAANEIAASALEHLRQRCAFSISSPLIMELNVAFCFFVNVVSQPFLLLSGGILTYCAPGTRKVLNFVKEGVTRLGKNMGYQF